MLDIGAVTGVLQDIDVDEETIRSIVTILETGIDVLDGPMQPVDRSVFGASHWGGELGHHTDIAYQKVTRAMQDMLIGLGHYKDGLERYATETFEVEGNVTAANTHLQRELDAAGGCLARSDVKDNPVCAAPPAEEG